jgi:hypothetical protein
MICLLKQLWCPTRHITSPLSNINQLQHNTMRVSSVEAHWARMYVLM